MIKDLGTGRVYKSDQEKGSNCIGCDSYDNNYNCKYCSWNSVTLK